jgi:hypothetical protein
MPTWSKRIIAALMIRGTTDAAAGWPGASEIDQEQQQRHPQDVGNDHVHAHVPAEQRDAIREPVGGRDHFAREQKEHHRFEVQRMLLSTRGRICFSTTR